MYNRGDSAGINPIYNSLLGFLPRSINPDKPHPSTAYGDDIYSQGMYLIWREVHGYHTVSMCEFSTGSHFYWELGLFGVFLFSAFSAIYIGITTLFLQRFSIVSVPLTVMLFKPWGYMDPKVWVSDIVIQIYQIILPLIFLYILLYYFFPLIKKILIICIPNPACR